MVKIKVRDESYEVWWRHATAERLKRRENRIGRLLRSGKITQDEAHESLRRVYEDASRLATGRLALHSEIRGFTLVEIVTSDGRRFSGMAACSMSEPSFNAEKGLTRSMNRALDQAGITSHARGEFWEAFKAARNAWRERLKPAV